MKELLEKEEHYWVTDYKSGMLSHGARLFASVFTLFWGRFEARRLGKIGCSGRK